MNADIQEQEFTGKPEACTIVPTSLDISPLNLKANDCLSNAGKIAQKYNFCIIVEGILWSVDREDGGMSFVRHAWNYDSRTKKYFDKTIELDEIKNNTSGKFEYTYFKCFEYTLDYAKDHRKPCGFQYSYNDWIKGMKSSFIKHYYRPRWTCGRYNAEKHVAIMYNLLAGYSFFFESYSADVVGCILAAGRDGEVDVNATARETNIAPESIQAFFANLYDNDLLTDRVYTEEDLLQKRKALSMLKVHNPNNHTQNIDDLTITRSDSEILYYNAIATPRTITSAMLELTYNCSEKCIHCYNHGATRNDNEISYRNNREELTLEEYKRIIDDLIAHGLVKVCLTGGDPFSNKYAWDIIEYLYNNDIAFDIYTNGQRLIGQTERLANYFPRLVAVSLYSTNADDHDTITRIKGTCEKSMTILRQLSELSVPLNIKCCIMQPNLHSYFTITEFARQIGAYPQYEIDIRDSNDGDLCARQLQLTKEQLSVVLLDTNIADNLIDDLSRYKTRECRTDKSSCKTGFDEFCITPEGNFQVCAAFPMPFGNLKQQTIDDIYEKSLCLKDWQTSVIEQYDKCGKYEYCKCCKPCAGLNYIEHKDFRKAATKSCKMAKERWEMLKTLEIKENVPSGQQLYDEIQHLPIHTIELKRILPNK